MTTTKQTVQAAASVVACSSSSDTIDSIDCALNSDDSDDSLLAAVIRSNNKQQQQSQVPRSVKRSTSVASPNNSSATDLTATNVAMNQMMSNGDNVANSPNVANLKHQPKKMKKKVVEHSVLRRTFSMTDEEFEDYEDDEEDEGIATNVAKCSLGDDDEEEDKDSVVETTTSEDEDEYEEVAECRNHKCINCCHEELSTKSNNSACAPMCQSYQSLHSEDDNTSDLTSSPPPPDVTSSSPSCYSSPTISPSSSSLNPDFQTLIMTNLAPKGSDNNNNTTSASPPPPPPLPESSNHHHYSESFTNDVTTTTTASSDNNNNGSNALYEKCQSTESGCCPLCCPDPEVRIGSDSPGSCTSLPQSPQSSVIPEMSCSKPHLLPYYPPTVSSIRDAVSHLTRLDDFNVVKLSHGFFSQVFKVIHFSTKKVMVLKMNKEAGNRGNALKEIELLNKLNHENIVAYMGTVVHEGALHPLLEFINGGTLEQLIRPFYCLENSEDISLSSSLTSSMNVPSPYQSRLSSSVCLSPKVHRLREPDWTFVKLMRDVARGMDYLHSNGYLHRDLASKNVFIRKFTTNCDTQQPPVRVKGQGSLDYQESVDEWWYDDDRLSAVIGDFGFATTEPMTPDQKLSTVGSPYWMAPECFKALWYNHKCDIYSFGVICCELNWRIPADPDYLPRCDDNFVVDFGKLYTKKDTTLGRVARMTCQTNPTARPEFSALLELLDIEMNKHENSVKNNVAKQVATINGSLDTSQMVDLNDTFDASSCNSSASPSPFTFKRGYSLDSTLLQCSNNSTMKKQQQQEPPKSPTKSSFNESDIFEQHLLRRRYSSALAAANGHKSIISPCSHNRTSSSTVSNCSKIASNNCTHAHYLPHLYHNHNHHHQQQRPLVYRNFSNPLPDIRHNSET